MNISFKYLAWRFFSASFLWHCLVIDLGNLCNLPLAWDLDSPWSLLKSKWSLSHTHRIHFSGKFTKSSKEFVKNRWKLFLYDLIFQSVGCITFFISFILQFPFTIFCKKPDVSMGQKLVVNFFVTFIGVIATVNTFRGYWYLMDDYILPGKYW